MTIKHKKRKIL